MNQVSRNVISSNRAKKASEAFARDSRLISDNEKGNFGKGELELVDRTIVLKTLLSAGEEQEILSKQKNKDSRTGINDFQDARLVSQEGGGSVSVDLIKLSFDAFAAGETVVDASKKSYHQVGWPADLENAELVFLQSGRVIQKIKVSEFAFKGDEPNTRSDQYKRLSRPFVIAAGSDLTIRLVRPAGEPGGEAFFAVEMQGMQTFPKRTRG